LPVNNLKHLQHGSNPETAAQRATERAREMGIYIERAKESQPVLGPGGIL